MDTRRNFLRRATLAGTTALAGLRPRAAGAEPPPETSRLRMVHVPGICIAPVYVADELLRAEGFTELQYVKQDTLAQLYKSLADREAHIPVA